MEGTEEKSFAKRVEQQRQEYKWAMRKLFPADRVSAMINEAWVIAARNGDLEGMLSCIHTVLMHTARKEDSGN